jgi:hypothetical protein
MNAQQKEPHNEPVTIEEKLEDLRRRLGRIEKHLIDIRGSKASKQS